MREREERERGGREVNTGVRIWDREIGKQGERDRG
jgi:hypothetical protein